MLGPINFLTRHLINVLVFSTAVTLTFVNFTGMTTMLALPLGAAAYFISNKVTYAIQKTTQSKKLGFPNRNTI